MSDGTEDLVRYTYRNAISGFFEIPTASAHKILPPFLQPVEAHHGYSVLSVMAFDFYDSPVGDYGELILSVPVAPRLEKGRPLPRSAFFPFVIGTTSREAREHAIERWHLPHYMENISITFTAGSGHIDVTATSRDAPIIKMRVTDFGWEPVEHRYQSFMTDADGAYMANITMHAEMSEHEEETGTLEIRTHPFTAALDLKAINTTPLREMWLRDGTQTFQPLLQIARAGE